MTVFRNHSMASAAPSARSRPRVDAVQQTLAWLQFGGPAALHEGERVPDLIVRKYVFEGGHVAYPTLCRIEIAAELRGFEELRVGMAPRMTGAVVGRSGIAAVGQGFLPIRLALAIRPTAGRTIFEVDDLALANRSDIQWVGGPRGRARSFFGHGIATTYETDYAHRADCAEKSKATDDDAEASSDRRAGRSRMMFHQRVPRVSMAGALVRKHAAARVGREEFEKRGCRMVCCVDGRRDTRTLQRRIRRG